MIFFCLGGSNHLKHFHYNSSTKPQNISIGFVKISQVALVMAGMNVQAVLLQNHTCVSVATWCKIQCTCIKQDMQWTTTDTSVLRISTGNAEMALYGMSTCKDKKCTFALPLFTFSSRVPECLVGYVTII